MVISFSIPEARTQLMTKGTVATFRWNRRKHIGRDWAQVKRGTEKIADVEIKEVGCFETIPDLVPYLSLSGFETIRDWRRAIVSTSKPSDYLRHCGWLYLVTRVEAKKEAQ